MITFSVMMPAYVCRDHRFAFSMQGDWVDAKQTPYMENQTFICECPRKHKMKLVKPSGLSGKRPFCDYFAHVQSSCKRLKKEEAKPSCDPSSESLEHRLAKQRLREMVGSYFFTVFRCQICSHERNIDTVGCSVLIEVVSDDRLWRYDCLLKRGNQAVAALEVFHTHLTGSEKTQSVRLSGLEIAEFRSQDVLRLHKECRTKLENLKMQTGMCKKCLRKATCEGIRVSLWKEWTELISQEARVWRNYELHEKAMVKLNKRYEYLLNESKIWILQCWYDEWDEAIMQENVMTIISNYSLSEKLMKRREERLRMKANAWIEECFFEEIDEIQQQESLMTLYYSRLDALGAVLQIADQHKRCQALIGLSLHRLKIEVPRIGLISFSESREWINGVLVYGLNKKLPTEVMCIVLISNELPVSFSQWKHNQVESSFHIFLYCSRILRELSSLSIDQVVLKDCRWPVLKRVEARHGICANCGIHGHCSDNCNRLLCFKCGRSGHLQTDCFANRTILKRRKLQW